MRKGLMVLLFGLCWVCKSHAQKKVVADSVAVVKVSTAAEFPKGQKGWHKFLRWKMDDFTAEPNYPRGDFELTVVVSFKVNIDGEVVEVRVHKSSGNSKIDSYAVRVLESSPKWVPATENGIKIKTKILQAITFTGRDS